MAKIKITKADENAVETGKKLAFSAENKKRIKTILSRYPEERSQSAVIPLLKLAQDQFGGWLSTEAMNLVAEEINLPYIRVYEVATFYTMFNLKPVGKYHLQVCTNCACLIRGSDEILQAIKEETGLSHGETDESGMFTVTEVECLGACVDAPMMQANNHYHTNLTAKSVKQLIADLKKDKEVKVDTPAEPLASGY